MLSRRINKIQVFFDHRESSTAELACEAASKALPLIKEYWDLEGPSIVESEFQVTDENKCA